MFSGFTFAIGAHYISEEVARFSPLWFPRSKLFVSLVSCDVLVILSVKRSYDHNDSLYDEKLIGGSSR